MALHLDRRRKYLISSDFHPAYGTHDEAEDAFKIFDKDGNGDLSRGEIKTFVLKCYKERRFLSRSLRDVGTALKTLDKIMIVLGLVFLFFISLSVFRVSLGASLTSVYSLGLGLSFIFKNSASNVSSLYTTLSCVLMNGRLSMLLFVSVFRTIGLLDSRELGTIVLLVTQ